MRNLVKVVFVLALPFLLLSNGAQAAGSGPYSVGAVLGGAFPSDNLGSRFAYGLRFGYDLDADWELGLSWQNSSSAGRGIMNLHGELAYKYEGFYFGGKVGITNYDTIPTISVLGVTVIAGASATKLSAGPMIGYDYEVAQDLTVGPSLEYIHVFADNSVGIVNALANVKYHF